jgi:methylenetetrahydrofolate reductase (NADPH)
MLKYMNSSVAGVNVPEGIMKRMEDARSSAGSDKKQASKNQAEEGIKITVELIQQVRNITGIKGVHIQAIEWEQKIPEIIKGAGLFPRP